MQRLDKKKRHKTEASNSTTPTSPQQTTWQGGYENIDTQSQSPDLPIEVWDLINSKLPLPAKMQFAQVSRGTYALGYVSHNDNTFFNDSEKKRFNDFYEKPFHNSFIRAGREQVQAFGLHVIRGEKKEAEEMIIANPSLLLETIRVKDFSGRTIEGTALGMALGAEDVSYDRSQCGIGVVQPPEDLESLTPDYIKHLNKIKKAGYVRCADKLFYRDKINDECIEIKLGQATLEQFDAELKPDLKVRTLSKQEIKKITAITGHDHYEEMAEIIQRHLRIHFANGEEIIASQIAEQFPEGWEEEEKKKALQDLQALENVFDAIATSKNDADCDSALATFRSYLEPKDVLKTGKHFNIQLLVEAFKLYDKNYEAFGGWESRKNNLFWQKVIGTIQRYLPANWAMAVCQGVYYIVEDGEKLKRSLKFRFDDVFFFPLDTDPSFRLGHEYAARGRVLKAGYVAGGTPRFANYARQKTSALRGFTQHANNHNQPKSRCAVM